MTSHDKILRSVAFSIGGTLASLVLTSYFSGIGIPRVYWIFAVLCSGILSGVVSAKLVAQSEQIRHLYQDLQVAHDAMALAAQTDYLTSAHNRRSFFQEVERCRQNAGSNWLLVLDIDHFKAINDRHGHSMGDAALARVSAIMRETVRACDIVARIGGEEFAVYLPGISEDNALGVAQRLRAAIARDEHLKVGDISVRMTASIGIVEDDRRGNFEHCLHLADMAMYDAKNGGRNQVARAA